MTADAVQMADGKQRDRLQIRRLGNGAALTVKVVLRSSKTSLAGVLGGMLKVKLAAAPEKGKANEALIDFLAETLGVKKNTITITAGTANQVKTIRITGVSAETLSNKLGVITK